MHRSWVIFLKIDLVVAEFGKSCECVFDCRSPRRIDSLKDAVKLPVVLQYLGLSLWLLGRCRFANVSLECLKLRQLNQTKMLLGEISGMKQIQGDRPVRRSEILQSERFVPEIGQHDPHRRSAEWGKVE